MTDKRLFLICFWVGCGLVLVACSPTAGLIAWREGERWLNNRGKS